MPAWPSGPTSSSSARAIGVSPATTTSGAGMTGSRKISNVPPDKHGLCTVSEPGLGSSGSGVIRSSSVSPESSNASACARTVDSAHAPPTKPSSVPSASTIASAPGLALVGFSATTTRACTYAARACRSSNPRAARSCVIQKTLTVDHVIAKSVRNGLPCMARQTWAGVSGMSAWRT